MNITEIFKDSFNYATKDWVKILILGLFVIGIVILAFLTTVTAIFREVFLSVFVVIITVLYVILVALIYNGYSLSIIKDTISGSDADLPEFDWFTNLIDGLKVLLVNIVYMIVPFIVGVVLVLIMGVSFTQLTSSNAAILTSSMFVVNIIITILAILFTLLAMIATARLAETGELSSIIEFEKIFETISNIGWGNYIVWFIIFYILIMLITFVTALINFIPLIGTIIFVLIVPGFLNIFKSRAIGLIYNESKG